MTLAARPLSAMRQVAARWHWSRRFRRNFIAVAGVALLVAGWIGASRVWAGVPGPEALRHLRELGGKGWCDEQPIACAVSKSMLTALALFVVGAVGYWWWRRRALTQYWKVARRRPEDLFDWLPDGWAPPRIVGRDELVTRLMSNLRDRAGDERQPQVVRGDSGSGKTALLLELTQRLAGDSALVVPVSLRNTGPVVDIVALAKERFAAILEDDTPAKGRPGRAWQQLCQDGRVVVVADGLDEITTRSALERDEIGRRALARARRRGVGVVVTTRAALWRGGVEATVHELEPLDEAEWVPYLEDRVGSVPPEDAARLRGFITAAGLEGRPVYLNIVARLYELAAPGLEPLLDAAAQPELPAVLRWRLLDAFVDTLRSSAQRSRVSGLVTSKVLQDLGWVAFALLRDNARELSMDRILDVLKPIKKAPDGFAVLQAADGAGTLGLVHVFERGEATFVRFAQADMQSYFAAQLLQSEPELRSVLLQHGTSAEFGFALSLYCWRALPDPALSAEICEALLARATDPSSPLPDDARLPSLAAAAEIAATAGISADNGLGPRIAAETPKAWEAAAHPSRLLAIPSIRGLRVPEAYAVLWERTKDPNYELRLAAAGALMSEADHAYRSLETKVSASLAIAHRRTQWSMPELQEVSSLGWILPSWHSLASAPELGEHVWTLVDAAVRPDVHIGFEASLCQGFKLDAYARPEAPVDECALHLIDKVRFWYSAVSLVHALVIRDVAQPSPSVRDKLAALRGAPPEVHPFVDQAAELGLRAIGDKQWRPYVWRDEAAAITTDGRSLETDASRLLADIVITLNLTERDGWVNRMPEIHRKYKERYLPRCLSDSEDRAELRIGHSPSTHGAASSGRCCSYGLCPYPPPWATGARGDFSQAFCREQRRLASRVTLREVLRRTPQIPWQRGLGRKPLTEFWEWMERRAEF